MSTEKWHLDNYLNSKYQKMPKFQNNNLHELLERVIIYRESIFSMSSNFSTGEYWFFDTSELSLTPELLNLHSDILALIPWIGCQNSDQGAQPIGLEQAGQLILLPGVTFLKLLLGDADIIAQLIGILTAIIDKISEFLTKLGEALWIAIKAVILIMIWFFFAINLILFIGIMNLVIISFEIMAAILNCDFGYNELTACIQNESINLFIQLEISETLILHWNLIIPNIAI